MKIFFRLNYTKRDKKKFIPIFDQLKQKVSLNFRFIIICLEEIFPKLNKINPDNNQHHVKNYLKRNKNLPRVIIVS